MTYYRLFCKTHQVPYAPFISTEHDELLDHDYEAVEDLSGPQAARMLREFHKAHSDCVLEIREEEGDPVTITRGPDGRRRVEVAHG